MQAVALVGSWVEWRGAECGAGSLFWLCCCSAPQPMEAKHCPAPHLVKPEEVMLLLFKFLSNFWMRSALKRLLSLQAIRALPLIFLDFE